MKSALLTLCIAVLLSVNNCIAQNDTVVLSKVSEFEYNFFYSAYTSLFDKNGADYLYTASNELGIVVFDISDVMNPVPVDSFPPAMFGGLRPTNIFQHSNYLYASLGGFQLFPQRAGIAVFDVSNPQNIFLTDVWDSIVFDQGCAIAISDGQYAYLGAMEEGLVIVDVSDKSDIKYVSNVVPDPNFPQIPGLFSHPNARGMALRNDTVFLAYDAGGLRMIDVSDKMNPSEISKYVNRSLDSVAQPAYNNVLLRGRYAYIPVDYCGLDIVDISDTAMSSVYWYNPWLCDFTNWQGRPGHTNQLASDPSGNFLFVSGADSEVLVFDLRSNPAQPDFIGGFIHVGDSVASWGVDVNANYVALSLVDNPAGVPYVANFGGIALLDWNLIPTTAITETTVEANSIRIFPNPATSILQVRSLNDDLRKVKVTDLLGRQHEIPEHSKTGSTLGKSIEIDISDLNSGLYFLHIHRTGASKVVFRFLKN